jgi:hypothetical protein
MVVSYLNRFFIFQGFPCVTKWLTLQALLWGAKYKEEEKNKRACAKQFYFDVIKEKKYFFFV